MDHAVQVNLRGFYILYVREEVLAEGIIRHVADFARFLEVASAIEVKRASDLGPRDLKGLIAFQQEYPEAQCFILSTNKRREIYRGFPIIPIVDFLHHLTPDSSVIMSV